MRPPRPPGNTRSVTALRNPCVQADHRFSAACSAVTISGRSVSEMAT